MRRIAIVNRKGGAAKSTTAVHLAAGLALAGRRVCLVDLDPQGNCSTMLGVKDYPYTISDVLLDAVDCRQSHTEARSGLRLIPADAKLAQAAETALNRPYDPQLVLKEKLEGLDFDYLIIDTPPSISRLTINAIFLADEILVPVSMAMLSMRGLGDVTNELRELQGHGAARLRWVVPTFVDGRKRLSETIQDALRQGFNGMVTPPIHYQARFDELAVDGETIFESDGTGRAAMDYVELVKVVLRG